MKLTSVELRPDGAQYIVNLSFRDPRRESSYNIKALSGLDVEEITPRYSGASENSGAKYYNLTPEKRDIVLRVELNPTFSNNETYSSLRDTLYKMIYSSRTGGMQLRFKNGSTTIAAVSGFVTKFEASHFSQTPEVQLTIKCIDPVLRALTPINLDVVPLNATAVPNITDILSTAPHGLTFDMVAGGNTPSFTIKNYYGVEWFFTVTPVGGFLTDDVLHCSSEYNKKEIYLTRGATVIQLADVITPGSAWPIIFPDSNDFVIDDDTYFTWDAASYYPTYWGV